MNFYKISFEGAFNYTFSNVEIDYFDGFEGELDFCYRNYVKIRGMEIPIRKTLVGSFGNEFMMAINSNKNNYVIKFLIDSNGGYKVKHCGSKNSYAFDKFLNLGFDHSYWSGPCLGEE